MGGTASCCPTWFTGFREGATVAAMRMQREDTGSGITSAPRRILLLAFMAGVTAALVIIGSGTPPTTLEQAAAAQARPNIVVIETDDQTLESMRVMNNVNTLIGDRGVTFRNSFVNYSLCCPSRATFLTGDYMHNHRVFGNRYPNGGFRRFQELRGNYNLAVWLQRAGYHTAMIGKYLNEYTNSSPVPRRLVGVARGPRGIRGLQLPAERERHPGPVRQRPRRLQAGRADPERGQLRRPPGAVGEAVLPLAHLHGAPLVPSGPESATAVRLPPRREAGAAPRPCVRLRAAAEAPELRRGQRRRQARRDPQPLTFGRELRSRTSSACTAASWNRCCRWTRG